MGRSPTLRGLPEAGPGAEADLRLRARREADRRRRPGPRGDRPQQLDPRRRGRDRRPPAAGDRPAAARRGPQRAGAPATATATARPSAQYKIVTQYSMGPIEEIGLLKMDFLGLRNLDVIEDAIEIIERSRGERDRHGGDPDRRRQDLRDARRGRLDRRLPVRVRGHARRAAQGQADRVRRHRRARRPLPARARCAYIPAYAKGKRDPASVRYPDQRLRAITEATYGCVIYQEQLMEIAREMAGFTGAEADDLRKAIGKKKRDLMATMKDKFMEGLAESEHRRQRRQGPLDAEGGRRRLLLQQVPRRLLRADLLPHRLPQGQLPGRVHGGGDLLGDVHQGQGPVLRQPLRGDGDRGAAARRQLLRPRLRRLREARSASASTRSRTSATRRSRRSCGAREDGADRLDLGLLRAGRRPRRQQAGDRVPDQVRRARLDRRHPQGHARGAAGGAVGRARRPRRTRSSGQGSIFDLGDGGRRRRRRAPRPQHRPPISADEFDRAELLALEKETLGTYLSSHPLAEVREALRARVDCSLAELAEQAGRRLGHGRRDRHRGKKIRTKSGDPDDVRDARRPRGPGRDADLQGRPGRERGGDRARRGRPRQPLRGDGDRGAAARRQLLRPQLRRLREGDPLRPRRGQERRPLRGRGDPARPRGRRRSPRSGTSASGSTRAPSTNGRSNA